MARCAGKSISVQQAANLVQYCHVRLIEGAGRRLSRLGLKERSWQMTMHLKKLVPDDIPELVSIEQECFSDPWSEGLLSALLESAFDETWVLRLDDGTAAGYINLRFLAGEGS